MPATEPAIARLIAALDYAAQQHRDQRRKGAEAAPYINHPIALLRILAVEAGVDDADVLVAAALHDVIEDCSGPRQEHIQARRDEIQAGFGAHVLALVEEVTDDKALPKHERKLAQIAHAPQLSPQARMVKLADKTANVRDIGHCPPADWEPARIAAYFDWAQKVVDAMRGVHARLESLFDAALAEARRSQGA